ncbi:anaerobic sulfatase maturase, partial [Verrucomicrobiota bacterium]
HSFGWQGGEPTLMGLDFFKKVTNLQKKYGRRGGSVSNGLQTNTTLIDDEFARHLAEYKFLVGVSIDGPPEIHDLNRITVDGRGSHADVIRGLECLKKNKVEYNILTLVNSANVKMPREIYHYLCDMGVYYHQYIECVEFDKDGNLLPFAINGKDWGQFLCAIYDEWIQADTKKVSVRLFDSIIMKMVDDVANTCSMNTDCRQYLVVEHNGDVYPCDFYVEPELKLGNIMRDSWDDLLESPLYEEFGRRKSKWNDVCAQCEYLKYCAGCCPKNRLTRGKDPSQMSMLCEGWKQFYHHSLKGFRRLANELVAERSEKGGGTRGSAGRNEQCPCGSGRKYKKCCGGI